MNSSEKDSQRATATESDTLQQLADDAPAADDGTETQNDERHLDDIFSLLSNSRRRAVLEQLAHEEASTVYDLSRHVAAQENGIPVEQVTAKQRKRVYIGLHQNHLPRMQRQGVIEYDKNRGTVVRADDSTIRPYLEIGQQQAGNKRLFAIVVLSLGVLISGILTSLFAVSVPVVVWAVPAVLLLAMLLHELR